MGLSPNAILASKAHLVTVPLSINEPMYVAVIPLKRLPGSFKHFTYIWEEKLGAAQPGCLVIIPWRAAKIIGLIWRLEVAPPHHIPKEKIKKVLRAIRTERFLDDATLQMAEDISSIYKISLSVAAELFLPPLHLNKFKKIPFKGVRLMEQMQLYHFLPRHVVAQYDRASFDVLSHHIARENMRARKQTILVFPHHIMAKRWINTCPTDLQRHLIRYDTQLSQKERFSAWARIKNDPRAIIVGEHLSLFAPTDRLGTIILAEEHDEAHKQWDMTPRYHNRDIAMIRAQRCGAQVILSSATPSVESMHAARTGLHSLFISPSVRGLQHKHPHTIIDLKNEFKKKNYSLVSDYVWQKTIKTLYSGAPVLYLLNQRGWGRVVGCRDCRFVSRCHICGVAQAYHETLKEMRCHHCQIKTAVPLACPNCLGTNIYIAGTGSEKLYSELSKRLRDAHINMPCLHIDALNAKTALNTIPSSPFLIIGTNAVLPYLKDIHLGIACIVNADRELARPEFRAQEKIFQEWWNLGEQTDELIIQTSSPDSPFLNRLSLRQINEWYEDEFASRKKFTLPPFCGIIKLIIEGKTTASAKRAIERLTDVLRERLRARRNISIINPIQAVPPVLRRRFRYITIIKTPANSIFDDARLINSFAPDACKTDVNPRSLFGD